jgi:hypothetical protein
MKKSILVLLLIVLASCATSLNVKQKENISLEDQLNSLEYKLVLPEKWHSYLDLHKEISYKPKNQSNEYPDVQIKINTIPRIKDKNLTLSELVDNLSKKIKFVTNYSQSKNITDTKFGKTYVVVEKFYCKFNRLYAYAHVF